jgi:hypothetical protein
MACALQWQQAIPDATNLIHLASQITLAKITRVLHWFPIPRAVKPVNGFGIIGA